MKQDTDRNNRADGDVLIRKPKVVVIGGPDVDARLPLMNCLKHSFQFDAVASQPSLQSTFNTQGFGFHSYRLGRNLSPVGDCLTFLQLVKLLRKCKPEIVHCFDTKPGIWGCLAARIAGVPGVVGTVTGLGSLYGRKDLKAEMAWKAYCQLQKLACRASDITVFQNHDDMAYFVSRRITAKNKTKIILGSGVPTRWFSQGRFAGDDIANVRADLGFGLDDVVVTMISRVMRSKGVYEFSEAARIVRKKFPNVRFLLVGADDADSIDRLSKNELAALRANLTWPGPRRDIADVLAASNIFVLPTAYPEGLPRVLLEAASMGLPLIATDAPGCREIVEHDVNGFLVPVGDASALAEATLRLVEQPQLRMRFGEESRRKTISRFDISVIAEKTMQVYHGLLGENASNCVVGKTSLERN